LAQSPDEDRVPAGSRSHASNGKEVRREEGDGDRHLCRREGNDFGPNQTDRQMPITGSDVWETAVAHTRLFSAATGHGRVIQNSRHVFYDQGNMPELDRVVE